MARNIFIDMDSKAVDKIKASDKGCLYDVKNIMTTKSESRGIFPEGKYLVGA